MYDSVYLEDLAGRLYGLVIIFSDRLPADQVQWLHHVVEVGEYGLALEDLAAMLAYDKIAVTDQERGDIAALARQMGTDLGPSWPGPPERPGRSDVSHDPHDLLGVNQWQEGQWRSSAQAGELMPGNNGHWKAMWLLPFAAAGRSKKAGPEIGTGP